MSSFQRAGLAVMKSVVIVTKVSSSRTTTSTPFSASQSCPPWNVRDSPTTSRVMPNCRTSPLQNQQGESVVTIVVPR